MAEDLRDALMKLIVNGVPIKGESSAAIGADDTFADGFEAASKANRWTGNFFELKSFKMDMGLLGDTAGDPAAAARQQQEAQAQLAEAVKQGLDTTKLGATRGASDFATFMGLRPGGSMKSYSSNLEAVVLQKTLDLASLTLFQACINSTTINSGTLIKRRATGGSQLYAYLRMDFTDLLITDFNWDEDDQVTEKISFVCRSCAVKYRIQQANGKFGAELPEQSWSVANLK